MQSLYRAFINLTNNKITSRGIASFTSSKASKRFVPFFSNVYKINQEEMEKPLKEYETLQQLFTRRLKENVRHIHSSNNGITSPVDGVVEHIGEIQENMTIVVKNKSYSIDEMLGSSKVAKKYQGGYFYILYLSPQHYHRIHSPISGSVIKRWSIGTKSYPVNKLGLKYGKQPLSKNYRSITEVTKNGRHVAIVKVGAMFVNSIEFLHEHDELVQGEEMAYFSFGSTVVLLFDKDSFIPRNISVPQHVKVGQLLGTWNEIEKNEG